MARTPGTPKTGGRKKGTPNKAFKSLDDYLESINFNVPEKIIEKMESLTNEEQVRYLFRLMEYLFPKKKAIEFQDLGEDRRTTWSEMIALLGEVEDSSD